MFIINSMAYMEYSATNNSNLRAKKKNPKDIQF